MPRATSAPGTDDLISPPKRVRRASRKKEEADSGRTASAAVAESVDNSAPIRRKAPMRRVAAPAAAPVAVAQTNTAAASTVALPPRRSGQRHLLVIVGALVVGIGASAMIGLSDKGKIDVAARIQEQGQLRANETSGEGGQAQIIPVQTTPVNIPNGGLIPAGAAAATPPPPLEPATTTATSTENEALPEVAASDDIGQEDGMLQATSSDTAQAQPIPESAPIE